MSKGFEIQHEWSPPDGTDSPDEYTRAALSVMLGGVCVTEVEDRLAKTTRPEVYLSARRMALWLAGNWWRLRWEPQPNQPTLDWQMSHNLASAGSGYIWPSITFGSDGESVRIRAQASPPSGQEPIRYRHNLARVIAANAFESEIDNFVNATIKRLGDKVDDGPSLAEIWAEIVAERNDPELYTWCQLEARLGHDPGEAPDVLIDDLMAFRNDYGSDAIQEIAAGFQEQALDHLNVLGIHIGPRSVAVQVPSRGVIRDQYTQQGAPLATPWQRGAAAAGIARSVWHLPPGPIRTGTLSDLFGLDITEYQADSLPISAGLRDDDSDTIRIALRSPRLTGRRFALARLAADHIAVPQEERLLPLTAAHTSRQKFQRAFAQELLCPVAELEDFLGTDRPDNEDIYDAAAHFEVSPRTVTTILVNKGIIGREALPA